MDIKQADELKKSSFRWEIDSWQSLTRIVINVRQQPSEKFTYFSWYGMIVFTRQQHLYTLSFDKVCIERKV